MHAVQHVLGNPDLFHISFAGVVMIAVDNDRRIQKPQLVVLLLEIRQILIMVIRMAATVPVNIAPQNRVCQRIAGRSDFPASVYECLRILRRDNGIHHDGKIAAGRIFHAGGNADAARDHPVLLILHRPCADRYISKQIRKITVIFRIQHLLGAGKACLRRDAGVHLTDRDDPCQHVFRLLRIRLVQHSFVSDAFCARLVRIDPRNDEDFVFHLLLHTGKSCHVLQNSIFPVRGAGTDNQQKPFVLPCKDIFDFLIPFLFKLFNALGKRVLVLQLLRNRKLPHKFHLHFHNNSLLPGSNMLRRPSFRTNACACW